MATPLRFVFLPAPSIFAPCDVVLLSFGQLALPDCHGTWSAVLQDADAFLHDAAGVEPLAAPPPQVAPHDILARIILQLQRAAGYAVDWYRHLGRIGPVVQGELLAVECANVGSARVQVDLAVQLLQAMVQRQNGNPDPQQENRLREAVASFPDVNRSYGGTQKFRLIMAVARRLGIPFDVPVQGMELLHLGQGAKRRNVFSHHPHKTGFAEWKFSVNKFASAQLMGRAGLPVCRNFLATNADQAVSLAKSIGFPVVIKPNRSDFGIGVSLYLNSEVEVRHAFAQARRISEVVVEPHLDGTNYRLLVMYGRVVAAVRQSPAQVTGDGSRSVRDLVAAVNSSRTAFLSGSLRKITLDAEAERILGTQGYALDDVPPDGTKVLLRHHSNLSVGGTMERVTDQVHPDNAAMAVRAARVMYLDVAGIDFVTPDISASWTNGAGHIIEINTTPGFIMGLPDGELQELFLRGMFPDGDDGRIPIIYVVDEGDHGDLLATLCTMLARAGHCPVLATPQEISLNGEHLCGPTESLARRLTAALSDPKATAAVVELSLEDIVRNGLCLDRCTLAVFGPGSSARPERDPQSVAAAALLASAAQAVAVSAGDALLPTIEENGGSAPIWRVVEAGAGRAAWRAAVAEALRSQT